MTRESAIGSSSEHGYLPGVPSLTEGREDVTSEEEWVSVVNERPPVQCMPGAHFDCGIEKGRCEMQQARESRAGPRCYGPGLHGTAAAGNARVQLPVSPRTPKKARTPAS